MYWAFLRKLPLFYYFFPPFTTFVVRQHCQCKLAILTNDTCTICACTVSPLLFPQYISIRNILPSDSYHWSIEKLFLVSWASRGLGTRGPIDFTLGFLTSNPLGGLLQTFICNLIFRAHSQADEYSITFPQEQDKVPYCSCPFKKICLFLLCGIL